MKIAIISLFLIGAMVLKIGIYFILFALLFTSSNALLGTSFAVCQSALFTSLLAFVLKLIFSKGVKNNGV